MTNRKRSFDEQENVNINNKQNINNNNNLGSDNDDDIEYDDDDDVNNLEDDDEDDLAGDSFDGHNRKKKTRTVFSRNQVFQLESTFDMKRYLSIFIG